MSRPRLSAPGRAAAVSALLACACGPSAAPPVEALGRPPVVLVLFDALDAGHLSHLGYPRQTTPNLDRLAAGAVSFSQAFAPAPYTVAGIPSLLTGRLPDSHGVTNQAARLADEETTLAEYLNAAGYRTLGAISNLNGGRRLGNAQGFDVFEELFLTDDPELIEDTVGGEGVRLVTADLLVDFAQRQLADAAAEPLFLYLHVLEPHAPYVMPAEYRELWLAQDYDGVFASGEIGPFVQSLNADIGVTARDVEAAVALYDANLRWADENFGRIRALLEEAGLWDEALVLVSSDHGEAFWQHGQWGHNDHLYDEQLRVPLIVKLPGERGPRGVVRSDLVSTLDLVPSICEWLDLPVGDLPLDGRSLAAMVEDAGWRPPERELLLRSHHTIAHLGVRSATHKTILERAEEAAGGAGFGAPIAVHHFDLVADPEEQHDLSARERGRLEPLLERLESWGQRAVVDRNERGIGMTRTELHMLKSLGYIDVVPPREVSYDERVRRAEKMGYSEVLEELTPESTREEWDAAIKRARARRASQGAEDG